MGLGGLGRKLEIGQALGGDSRIPGKGWQEEGKTKLSPQCRTPALGGDQRPGERQMKPQLQTIAKALCPREDSPSRQASGTASLQRKSCSGTEQVWGLDSCPSHERDTYCGGHCSRPRPAPCVAIAIRPCTASLMGPLSHRHPVRAAPIPRQASHRSPSPPSLLQGPLASSTPGPRL